MATPEEDPISRMIIEVMEQAMHGALNICVVNDKAFAEIERIIDKRLKTETCPFAIEGLRMSQDLAPVLFECKKLLREPMTRFIEVGKRLKKKQEEDEANRRNRQSRN